MSKNWTRALLAGVTLLTSNVILAGSAFTIRGIKVDGLQRLPLATVKSDIALKVGDNLNTTSSDELIESLYKTGYFSDISLSNDNGLLIIHVKERPTIAKVDFSGNELIKKEQLDQVLLQQGIATGNILDRSVIKQMIQSLEQEYYMQGKYAVKVDAKIVSLPRNRVEIKVNISEGLYNKIKRINIVGNHAFSQKRLLDHLVLTTPTFMAFFTSNDQYSSQKMQKSLDKLRDFYMDRGYVNFRVNSYQVSLDPTRRYSFLNINIHEGHKYTFAGFKLKGNLILPEAKIKKLVEVHAGDVFSRRAVVDTANAIVRALGNAGHAFASVNPVPHIDAKTKKVTIEFYVNPAKKVYVRYINFSGNNVTNDVVLRQKMQFVEDSLYNANKIDDSKIGLQRYPFIESVDVKKKPVANSDDLVDINYRVKERNANTIQGSLGYSELDKVLVGANLNMPNLFGTGNIFNISAQLSKPYQSLNFTYTEPFFTMNGISQSVNVYLTRIDNSRRNLANFSTNSYGGNLNYAIPLSSVDYFNAGMGIDNTTLQEPSAGGSMTVKNFLSGHTNNSFNTLSLNLGWSRNSTNNAFFATRGATTDVGVKFSAPFSNLAWYKLHAKGAWYHQLPWKNFSVGIRGGVEYGNGYGKTDHLPFFDNFYGGGWGTVRGFAAGSLGPKDKLTDQGKSTWNGQYGNSIGGNLAVYSSFNVYFPVPFATHNDNLRLGAFVDMGNVYDTFDVSNYSSGSPKYPNFSNLRYSVGLSLEWISPLGPLGFSIAKGLNVKSNDNTEFFQLTLGQSF